MDHESTPRWLADLLEAHGPALVLYARRLCSCPEDVVQEAFIKLVSQAVRPRQSAAWLYRVVRRNLSLNTARSERRRKQRERHAASPEAWFAATATSLDAGEATEALRGLPVELHEVVVARIWGGLSFAEIAELTGSSTSTAQRRYEQGLKTLQQRLEMPCETNPRTKPN